MTNLLPLRRLSAVTRLAVVVTVCAALAGAVPGAERPRGAAAAGGTSLGTSGVPGDAVRDSADEAITRSTTNVATRATVASPDVASLPSVVTSPADLPAEALDAYVRAAEVIASVKPGCHLGWPVLAALGQVESDHGRSGGGHLLADGSTSTPVRGQVLDGSGARARVPDTDGGLLDGIGTWDRAVGPMQFLPSTWIAVRVDGDGDGVRSPDDINDASLAAAVFLCAGDDDLSSTTGARAALGRFNHTRGYAAAVQELSRGYAAGTYGGFQWQGVATATWAVPPYAVAPTPTSNPEAARARHLGGSPTTTVTAGGALHTATATKNALQNPAHPTSSPTPGPGAGGTTSAGATPSETPTATSDPSPTSTPTPGAGSSSGPSSDPGPSPTPDPPAPDPTTTVSGVLQTCGDGAFCLDGTVLDLGKLDVPAAADFDGDGTTGTRAAELTGLVGTTVKVTVQGVSTAGKVLALDGLDWS